MQRPKRAAASKPISYADAAPSSDDDGQAQRSTRRPAKKPRLSTTATKGKGEGTDAATTTAKSTRRRKGQLSAFLNLPLDLVLDLASQADLSTLLSLSRANKLLYGLFASRSAAPIWASARSNSGIPDIEAADLNDKQLAALLFDRDCHLCGKNRSVLVDYAVRARWCKNCRVTNLLTASELHARGVVKQMDSCARECSLSFYHERNRTTYFRLEDVQSTNDRLKQLRAKLTVAQRLAESSRPYTNSRRNPVEQAKVDETLKKAAQAVVAAEQPLGTFIRERRVLAEAARRDADAWVEWELRSAQAVQRAEILECERRRIVVTDRLIALGHDAYDCIIPSSLYPIIDGAKELTDDIWTRISPTLIEAVEEHKVERVARALAYVRLGAMRAQHELVRRRHKALFQAQQGEAFVTWPAFEVFQLLPTVERHWIGDVVSKTEADWTSDLPAILAEVDAARRAIKIGFARDVMNKLRATGVYVDEGLAVKLEHPRQRVTPIGASMRSTPIPDCRHLERLFQAGRDISVDLGDIASDVDDSELDRLFSHPSAVLKIKDRRKEFATPFRYPQIHAELRDRGAIGTASCASFLSAADLALSRFQVDVLAHVGLAGLAPTDPTLLTRGPIFPCLRCIADGRKPSMMAKLRGWAGTMDHYDAVHA